MAEIDTQNWSESLVRVSLRRRMVTSVVGLPLLPLSILLFIVIAAFFPAAISPHDPLAGDLNRALTPPFWQPGGSSYFPLGTDWAGRDLLSRMIWGARVSLLVGVVAVLFAGTVGTLLGLLAGYLGGLADTMIMRVVDIALAMPFILVAIIIVSIFQPSIVIIIAVVGLQYWATYARMLRADVLSIKEKEFVALAVLAGSSRARVIFRHILPNVLNTAIVLATLNLGSAILFEAALSFLGMGVQPPTPAWGLMLYEARGYITRSWWLPTFPGLAIMVTVLACNLLGDWARDHLDPRLRQV